MKSLLLASAVFALAALSATIPAAAIDLDDDDDIAYENIVDEPRVIVRERIIIREYVTPRRGHRVVVDHDDDDDDVHVVRRRPRHHYVVDDHWDDRRVIHGPGYRRVYYKD